MPDTDAHGDDVEGSHGTDWVSVTTAAAILGVSRQTLARWDRDGTLPAYRNIAGHRRYIRGEMEALRPSRAA